MGISRIEVDEYTCEICGYKWISRINGESKPKPKRCAKCKDSRWEHGQFTRLQKVYRRTIIRDHPRMDKGSREGDDNVRRFLASDPSDEDLMLVANPMCRIHDIPFKNNSDRQEYYMHLHHLQFVNLQWVMEELNGIPYIEPDTPPELSRWAERLFTEGNKTRRTKEQTAELLVAYAKDRKFRSYEIAEVLRINGITDTAKFVNEDEEEEALRKSIARTLS